MTDVDMLIFGERNRLAPGMRGEVIAGNIAPFPGRSNVRGFFYVNLKCRWSMSGGTRIMGATLRLRARTWKWLGSWIDWEWVWRQPRI